MSSLLCGAVLPAGVPPQHPLPRRLVLRGLQRHPGIRLLAVPARQLLAVWRIRLHALQRRADVKGGRRNVRCRLVHSLSLRPGQVQVLL